MQGHRSQGLELTSSKKQLLNHFCDASASPDDFVEARSLTSPIFSCPTQVFPPRETREPTQWDPVPFELAALSVTPT